MGCPIHNARVLRGERRPREMLDLQPFAFELAALADDLAPAFAHHRVQVVGEFAVAAVAPVELHGVTHREPAPCKLVELVFGQEERVRRADAALVAEPLSRVEQGARHRPAVTNVGPHEELRAGRGCERHGGGELRVVRDSVLVVRPRPLPIEDVLAKAIRLEVDAKRAEDASCFVSAHKVDRRPSAPSADAARAFECAQELEIEEREIWRL
jgi:hypothetical protein